MELSYFQLFSLPESYDINSEALLKAFETLAKKYHPDRVAGCSAFEKRQYTALFTTLNEAYRVLKDPVTRAEYCLSRLGINYDPEKPGPQSIEFLEQQMQWHERLNLEESADPEKLAALKKELDQEQKLRIQKIAKTLKIKDSAQSIVLISELKFFRRLNQILKDKEKALKEG